MDHTDTAARRRPATCYLVGAGPGHPGLLTLRAVECLRRADLVLYDKLVPPALLEYAPPVAERVCVNELAPRHVERAVPVHEAMIHAARAGRRVVRLKGGDPCLFGRAGEEADALRQAGVPFEIVPGVTAALGAAACAGIPLTHRNHASAVAFVTGHEDGAKPESALDWAALARFPGTLVVYMGMSRLERLVRALIENGRDPRTPAAVVQRATTGEQRTVAAALDELPARTRAEGLTAPALVFIGSVVTLHPWMNWFEQLPLFGKRVLVTRPRHQAGSLVARLVELGAVPFVLPTVEIAEVEDWGPVDRAIAELDRFTWLVFTSANGVTAFLNRLRAVGRDLRALGRVKIACIGPATAQALRGYHLEPDLVPSRYLSEDLAAALRDTVRPGERVLLARADRGRAVLHTELSAVCAVEQVTVYRQIDTVGDDEAALDALRRGEVEFVTLTSSNVARALIRRLDAIAHARLQRGEVKLVTISPVTSAAVRELGLPIAAEAAEATTEGVVAALVALVSANP